jgi:putative membrane-bound dehydrogenase-like protein
MRAGKRPGLTGRSCLAAALLLMTAGAAAIQSQRPATPAAGAETRDRYLNPRETDISLGLKVDPKDVPDIPPVEPDRVHETFRIRKGFRLELVAHEPMVIDPIQMAFDEDGRLYVVEMRWYQSETRSDLMFDERIGRIRRLEDTNGDGRFDKSTIFADKLRYPSAVLPYDGGAYVGLEPDIVYFKDRDGDGVADSRQVVFTGFGNHRDRLDSQMFLNSLTWSLDNRIHGAKGHGGTITPLAAPGAAPLDLRNRDFSFDPRTHRMIAETGGGKQGLSFDDYGRKFVCSANSAVQLLMYEERYSARNPFFTPPRPLIDIGLDPGETLARQRVYRISPEDPWRRIRNRWRAEGVFAGPPPQPPAYLIGASGVTIYRGDAFPAEYRNSAFVGIAGNNLLHHRMVVPEGVGFRAPRAPDAGEQEFLASTDLWFRPVALANGPDGALYVADLYREILDFSDGIPESIKRFKDLNRGNDRGRIYRIVPEGFRQPRVPRLGAFSTAQLVATLEHSNGWHRDTASRLLYERQDKAAIPLLARLAEQSASPLGRLHALYSLDGMAALAESYVIRAFGDADPNLREHAVRLSERLVDVRGISNALWDALKPLAHDPHPRVRYQLAFTLGTLAHPEVSDVLLQILQKDVREPWIHVASLFSIGDAAGELFGRITTGAAPGQSAAGDAFLRELVRVIGARNRGRELLRVLNALEAIKDPEVAFSYLAAFADGLERADVPLALFQAKVQPILDHAADAVRSADVTERVRLNAIALLGRAAATPETTRTLLSLIGTDQPGAIRSATLATLGRLDDPSLAGELITRWATFPSALRREILPVLLATPERAMILIDALRGGAISQKELTPTQAAGLRAHRNAEVRRRANAVLVQAGPGDRRAVIERYLPALELPANLQRGRTTYEARCATCHQPDAEGHTVGPAIGEIQTASKEEILTHLLDPNRTVDPRYRLHTIETAAGTTISGTIQQETQTTVILRPPFGGLQTVPRSNIVRMQGLEQSMMPEGLEEGLSLQDMADLLEFLRPEGRR